MTHWAAELPSQWLDGATCTSVVCSRPVARVDMQTPTVRATRTIMPQWVFWDAVALAAALLAAEDLAMLTYEDEIASLRALAWEGWTQAVMLEPFLDASLASPIDRSRREYYEVQITVALAEAARARRQVAQYEDEVARLAARVAVLEADRG